MKLFFGFILIKQNLQEKISRFPHESRFVSCDVLTPHLALHLSCSGVVSKPAIYELALYILHMEWLFCLYPSSCLGMDFHQQTVAKEIPLVHKWPAIQLKARCCSVSSLNVHLTDEVVVLYPPPIHAFFLMSALFTKWRLEDSNDDSSSVTFCFISLQI